MHLLVDLGFVLGESDAEHEEGDYAGHGEVDLFDGSEAKVDVGGAH